MVTAAVSELSTGISLAAEHEEIFYQSAEFWVGAAFVLVVAALFVPVSKAVLGLINSRIERIKNELQEAETLKLDAQKLYAEYERKFVNTDKEVAAIIANQQEVIEQTKQQKLQEMNILLKHKQEEAEARMEQTSQRINTEINGLITQRTLHIIQQILNLKLTQKDYSKLIDNSIENIKHLDISK